MSIPPHYLALISILVGGFAFRLGHDHSWSSYLRLPGTLAKVMYAVVAAVMHGAAELLTQGALTWATAALMPAIFLSCTVPSFDAIDAGANDGTPARDAAFNLLRGMLMAAVPAAVAWYFGPSWNWPAFIVAGALVPACYELGKRTKISFYVWRVELKPGPPRAEFYVGAVFSLAAVLSGTG